MDLLKEAEAYKKMYEGVERQAETANSRADACERLALAIQNFECVMLAKVDISIKPKVSKDIKLAEKLAKAEDKREESGVK